MQLVLDTNQFKSPRLNAFLSKSAKNRVVLFDYSAMEMYKAGGIAAILEQMEILGRFSDQVIVLKDTMSVCAQRGRRAGLQRRLIDKKHTNIFRGFVSALEEARAGDEKKIKQVEAHKNSSAAQMLRVLDDAATMGLAFPKLLENYSKEERARIKGGDLYSSDIVNKIMDEVLSISAMVLHQHPSVRYWPSFEELPYTFIFRLVFCTYLLALDRAVVGLPSNIRPESIRNDLIDMYFVAYGTFFDGVMSSDRRVNRIYEQVDLLLKGLLI
ncbi:hypothetical protein C7A11_28050 [Pseudomonas simiae]|uniref:hypothetical protein n=1 Tax=Pseudomonas simiae TaxID=321846 RepID=UPI000D033B02|nr:hypothetical protein [Pseudomonas simiae]PRW84024.1 hypothetical protein C7A11_28050 [Pseudomonas simiae]